jgi:AP2 domain.
MARKTIPLPSSERLHAVLSYDPATGALTWKTRPVSDFEGRKYPAERLARSWNAKNAGKPALADVDGQGYRYGSIDGTHYKAARVIWKMMTGDEPDTIDHDDGVRTNNRWGNLINGTSLSNQRNLKRAKNNKSGVTGVRQLPDGRWKAEIQVRGANCSLGIYATIEQATAARHAAERFHGFAAGHGRR